MAKSSDESAMSYDDFRDVIRTGDYLPLYLFCGEETFLLEFCIDELKKNLINPAFEDFNYKRYNEAPDFESASSFIFSLPLMSEKKLVVFNDCSLFNNQLPEKARWAEMFSNLPQYAVVIVRETAAPAPTKKRAVPVRTSDVKTAVTGAAQTVNFKYLSDDRLRSWLMRGAAGKGKSLSAQNARYIVSELGRSMITLRTELEKIAAKCEGNEITRADIDSVIIKPLTATVFKLIDALCSSRRDLAFSHVAELRAMQADTGPLMGAITTQILSIHKAKVLLSGSMSASDVKKTLGGGFKADKLVSNASKVPLSYIENIIHFLKETDRGLKVGEKEVWTQLDLLVAL